MSTAYIAGPMRGIFEYNFPAFFDAQERLENAGFETINPAQRDEEGGFAWAGLTGHENLDDLGFDLTEALAWDLDKIAREADVVVLLPGWEASRGAQAEVATAKALGKGVLALDEATSFEPGERVAVVDDRYFDWDGTLADGGSGLGQQGVVEVVDPSDGNVEVLMDSGFALYFAPASLRRVQVVPSPLEQVHDLFTRKAEPHWLDSLFTRTDLPVVDPEAHPLDVARTVLDGEVRMTSASGGAKGAKLARFDMIPTDSLVELAEQFGKGAIKYDPVNGIDNWRNGYPWSLSFGAAMRHLVAAMGGEDIDEETGSKHVIAVAWHMLTLAHHMNNPLMAGNDDRQDVIERAVHAAL